MAALLDLRVNRMRFSFRTCRPLWVGLALLLLLSLPFALTRLDLVMAGWFYNQGWPIGDGQPWLFLYRYGTLPGLLLSAGALAALLGGWIWPRLRVWRRPALLLVLTLVIGPGLLVNSFGKGYWGRPRPRDVQAFGGTMPYHAFYQPGTPGRGASFPCGHASVGFLIAAVFFADRARRRRWAWFGAGLSYGTLMGMARMAQGAHFASDVLWSGGLTFLTAAALDCVLPNPPGSEVPTATPPSPRERLLAIVLLILALLGLVLFFVLATPYSKEWSGSLTAAPGTGTVRLSVPPGQEDITIRHAAQEPALVVHARLRGFGFPKVALQGRLTADPAGRTLDARLELNFNRPVTERLGTIDVRVREGLALGFRLQRRGGNLTVSGSGPFERVEALEQEGDIQLDLEDGARVSGPVRLISRKGLVRVLVANPAEAGPDEWETGTRRGDLSLGLTLDRASSLPWRLRAWTPSGTVDLEARVNPACGLDLTWDEGDGRSSLSARGDWLRLGERRVAGPDGMAAPAAQVHLATTTGLITMRLRQGPGPQVGPTATPTAEPFPASDSNPEDLFMPPAPEPPRTPVPAWAEEEFIRPVATPNRR